MVLIIQPPKASQKTILSFIHQFFGTSFNCICETDKYLWFGTDNKGILTLDKKSHHTGQLNSDSIAQEKGMKVYLTCILQKII